MRKENIINDGIPEEIFELLRLDFYDAEEQKEHNAFCSVTDLLNPPKIFWLKKRYDSDVKTSASDFLWSVFGSLFHEGIEKALMPIDKYELEKRLYKPIIVDGQELIVSGKFDIYNKETKTLKDLKTTSIYKVLSLIEGKEDKFPAQLNIYKYLAKGIYEIDKLSILYFAKDHDKRKARYNMDYPSSPVGEIEISIWGDGYVENFIKTKLLELWKYRDTEDNDIPACPIHERYQDVPTLALYSESGLTQKGTIKKSGKATKLFDTIDELSEYVYNKGLTLFGIQFRPMGTPKRCIDYCKYNIYCNFYKETVSNFDITQQEVDSIFKITDGSKIKIESIITETLRQNLKDEDFKLVRGKEYD